MKTALIVFLISLILGISANQCGDIDLYGPKEGYKVAVDTETKPYPFMPAKIGIKDTSQYKLGPKEIETIPNN